MNFEDLDIDEVIKVSKGFPITSGLYKNTILCSELQKINGFIKYAKNSRDLRVKLLSYILDDRNENYMAFRRIHSSWYCSEFWIDTDSKKEFAYSRSGKQLKNISL